VRKSEALRTVSVMVRFATAQHTLQISSRSMYE
jgi:hypothetical protein